MKYSMLIEVADLFKDKMWYYLIGAIGTIVTIYINIKKNKKSDSKEEKLLPSSNNVNNNIPININVGPTAKEQSITSSPIKNVVNTDLIKGSANILFVDDEYKDYLIVSNLKKAGYTKTKAIKDVKDLDCLDVVNSKIIFVDINGVGTLLSKDQGLGLAKALKEKYPQKKIVIYSAESSGNIFHDALRLVDGSLPKNADLYQFIHTIDGFLEDFIKEQ